MISRRTTLPMMENARDIRQPARLEKKMNMLKLDRTSTPRRL